MMSDIKNKLSLLNLDFDVEYFATYFTDDDIEIVINEMSTFANFRIPALDTYKYFGVKSYRIYFKYFDLEENLYQTNGEVNKILTIMRHLNETHLDFIFDLVYRIIPITYNIRDIHFPHYLDIYKKSEEIISYLKETD